MSNSTTNKNLTIKKFSRIYVVIFICVLFIIAIGLCTPFLIKVIIGNILCDSTHQSVLSPNHEYEARITSKECGAFDGGSTSVYLRKNKLFKSFHKVYFQSSNPSLTIKWIDDSGILIFTNKYARLVKIEKQWELLNIQVKEI